MKFDADKRVFGYPFVSQCKVGYLLQTFHVTDNGVLLAGFLRFEIELKGTYQLSVNFSQWQILFPVFLSDKLGKITLAAFITTDGNQCVVLADKRTALVIVFPYGADERADFFRFLVLPEELFLQQTCCDGLVLFFLFTKNLMQLDSCVFDIGIQVA